MTDPRSDEPVDVGRWIKIVLVALLTLYGAWMYAVSWLATQPARDRMAQRRAAESEK